MSSSSAQLHRDALAAGTVLNGYQILGVLGRGGFGITYRASDLLDQSFAIKEFFPRQFAMRSGHDVVVTSESDQAIFVDCRRRFLTEARLLSTLGRNGGTAGVVQVATFFEANNTAYSVMELLAGETLDDVLGAGVSLSPQVLFAMLRGILTPLARVHAAGFLHRDIKPSNILIRPDGQPVLIDFGSARDMRPTANTTYTQVYSGHYAPIEQMIHGAPQGPYSDIYSVGGVAYRAIGGKLVDARARQQATLSRARDPLVPAADIGRDRYPASLLLAIDRALAVSANERPQRVEEMLALLDNTFDGEATILRSRPVESRVRISAPAARPTRHSAMSLNRVWSSVTGAFSGMAGLSHAWKRDASQQSISKPPLQQQRGKSRAVIPAAIVAAAVLIGIFSYVWFSGQSQPADTLANLQVVVDRNGNEISAKFPQTTDTAKLIAALPYLIKLKVTALDLSNSQIVTLPSLQGLSSLTKLNLHGSQVTTLLSLRGLTALRELDLSQTKLTTLPSLQDQGALQKLNLSYSGITTLPSLDGLASLRELDLSHTNVAAMPPLEGLTELRELDLTDTNVTSLPGIQGLTNLHVTPDWLRVPEPAPAPAPEQRPVATAPFPPDSPALATPSPEPKRWLEPLPPPVTPPIAAPPAVLRPPLSRPLPTPPAPPPRIAPNKPPPPTAKESPAPTTKPGTQAPTATEPPAARRSPENEESRPGYEYFSRGYAAFQSGNYAEAMSLYKRGADNGDPNCMYWLGQLYKQGSGVAPNYREALSWYQKAANHGYAMGYYGMGLLYFEGGPSLAKDCTLARKWLTTAANSGVNGAKTLLNQPCY
jgi:serine/threonine protein kinase